MTRVKQPPIPHFTSAAAARLDSILRAGKIELAEMACTHECTQSLWPELLDYSLQLEEIEARARDLMSKNLSAADHMRGTLRAVEVLYDTGLAESVI